MRVLRRIGQGDLEHVRYSVLQVTFPGGNYSAVKVAEAAFRLGDELQMMTRLHLNTQALSAEELQAVETLHGRNQAHQLELWQSRAGVEQALLKSDFIFQCGGIWPALVEHDDDAWATDDLVADALGLWYKYGRRLLEGNHQHLTKDQLKKGWMGWMVGELR